MPSSATTTGTKLKLRDVLLLMLLLPSTNALGVAYSVCQGVCAAGVMGCYSTAGVVWGVGSVPVCNAAYGACSAKCAVVFWM